LRPIKNQILANSLLGQNLSVNSIQLCYLK